MLHVAGLTGMLMPAACAGADKHEVYTKCCEPYSDEVISWLDLTENPMTRCSSRLLGLNITLKEP